MTVICKDNTYTFRNLLTIDKKYEVLKSYNDPEARYKMVEVMCDDGKVRPFRANRFTEG